MRISKKIFAILILGIMWTLMALGISYSSDQAPAAVQPNTNYDSMAPTPTVNGNAATPKPTRAPKHKKNHTVDLEPGEGTPPGQRIPNEGTPPGYPANATPTSIVTQVSP